jgi:uncharacterized surface protein with fasciclin (FAS1) repeats
MNPATNRIAPIALSIITLAAFSTASLAQCSSSAKGKTSSDNSSSPDIVATAKGAGQFGTLLAAAKAAGLVGALQGEGPLTVFAPTDDAFAKLPKGTVENLLKPENRGQLQAILKYHVIAGKLMAGDVISRSGATTLNGQRLDFTVKSGSVMVDNARVVKTDIKASNGVIHVIDSVVLPSSISIVETAKNAGKFNTLLIAATEAGIAGTLSNDGPFTIFAPTDEAFAKLPDGTVESLLKPENRSKLVKILKYHVVPGRVYSSDVVKINRAKTLEGDDLRIAAGGSGVRINDALVIKTDLDASNGVIHVVDRVILPQ